MKGESVAGGGNKNIHSFYFTIISKENIFGAWREFKKGKIRKRDVLEFNLNAEYHLLNLQKDLIEGKYKHGSYTRFTVCDPKKRIINKASVRDRVLHHAIHRILYPYFDKKFIHDSYSSRIGKGTLKAIERFEKIAKSISQNNTRTVWILKCDIKKFFDTVDHSILKTILVKRADIQTYHLLSDIISSFEVEKGKGIPLGNLTSQLFSNVYLNEFDNYIKRFCRFKNYIRYADDFFLLSHDKVYLEEYLKCIRNFLKEELFLELHDSKVFLIKWHQGVDVLGYISFPYYRVLRTKTKKRMFRKLDSVSKKDIFIKSHASYNGRLKHCSGKKIQRKIIKNYFKI